MSLTLGKLSFSSQQQNPPVYVSPTGYTTTMEGKNMIIRDRYGKLLRQIPVAPTETEDIVGESPTKRTPGARY